MYNKIIDVKLSGYALIKAELAQKNEKDEIINYTQKIVSCKIECPAKKMPSYQQIEHYTIDESIVNYDEKDIKVVDCENFAIVSIYELEKVERLKWEKDINEFLENKYSMNLNRDSEISKIIEILDFDLSEEG